MDAIIILSGRGPGPGLDFHVLMITPDLPSSVGDYLLSQIIQRQKTGQAFPLFSQIKSQGSFQGFSSSWQL